MAVIGVVDPAPAEARALAGRPGLVLTSAVEEPAAEIDVVVVGSLAAEPLATVRRLAPRHPDAAFVLLRAPGAAEAPPEADLPADLAVVDPASGDLASIVAEAAERVTRERRRRVLLAAVTSRRHGEQDQPAAVAQASLGALLANAAVGVAVTGADGVLVSWNDRAAELLALPPDAAGAPLRAFVADPEPLVAALDAAVRGTGPDAPVAAAGPTPEIALELTATLTQLDDGRPAVLVLVLDATGRRAAEQVRDELSARLDQARRAQAFLLGASDALARASGFEETLRMLAAVAVPTLGDLCLIDVIDDDGAMRRVVAHHADPRQQPLADELMRRYRPMTRTPYPGVRAIEERRSQFSAEISDEFIRATSQDEAHYRLIKELAFSGYMSVPLLTETDVLGSISLISAGSGRRFEESDLALAESLAGRVALVVAKARRYEEEHRIAEALQRSLLSPMPAFPPLELDARYVAARQGSRVGGDWYDAFTLPDDRLAVIIGDVVGHDLGAAARMGQLRNALRSLAWDRAGSPADILDRLDRINSGLGIAELATVVHVVVDRPGAAGCRIQWANAGHLPPLLVDAGGSTVFLDDNLGVLLGAPSGGSRADAEALLAPGATLLLYTDGLVESRTDQLEGGLAMLELAASRVAAEPLVEMCSRLIGELAGERDDDVALLAVRLPAAPEAS
ncbi:MAG: SpoIIE family protein phosphatase [Frankiaceae bacterium]